MDRSGAVPYGVQRPIVCMSLAGRSNVDRDGESRLSPAPHPETEHEFIQTRHGLDHSRLMTVEEHERW